MQPAVSQDDGGSRRQLSKDTNHSPNVDNHRAIVFGSQRNQRANSRNGQGSEIHGHCRLHSHNALRGTGQPGDSSHSRHSHMHDSLQRQPRSRSPPAAMRRYLAEGKESNPLERISRNVNIRGDERMSLYIDTWEKVWEEVSSVDARDCTLKELKAFGSYLARPLMLPSQHPTVKRIQTS